MRIFTNLFRSNDYSDQAGGFAVSSKEEKAPVQEEPKKGFFQKIKEALQDWSNQEYKQTIEDDQKV